MLCRYYCIWCRMIFPLQLQRRSVLFLMHPLQGLRFATVQETHPLAARLLTQTSDNVYTHNTVFFMMMVMNMMLYLKMILIHVAQVSTKKLSQLNNKKT